MGYTRKQYGVNGYLEIAYGKDDFIEIIDTETNHEIRMHNDVISLLYRTIRDNKKSESKGGDNNG